MRYIAFPVAKRIGILLIPGFSMMAFSSAIEPLRSANRLVEHALYEWHLLSPDGQPVCASNGITIGVDMSICDLPPMDMLFVCSGIKGQTFRDRPTLRHLRHYSLVGTILGGISSGPHILARAGLLNGYRCTIHWEDRLSFCEEFPDIRVTDTLYEIDRERYTCSGGIAAMDMMLSLIASAHGEELAAAVAQQFIHDHTRQADERQRPAIASFFAARSSKVGRVIALMESNIERPLALAQIAEKVGITVRHMERLFRAHVSDTPARHYLNLRLRHARHLLQKTALPIMQIALAAGFVSASHFSRVYRALFGRAPTEDRRVFDHSD